MMSEDWQFLLPLLIGIIPGTLALIIQALQWWSKRKQSENEAEKIEVERKNIEEEITERVLARAKEHINGLTSENETLKCEMKEVIKEKEALAGRVNQLEERCVVMQAEYEKLEKMIAQLRRGITKLCKQISDAGLEPAFTLEELDGGD